MTSSTDPTFPAEVTAHILTSPAIVTDEDTLKCLCLINHAFSEILQPHLFRNINLRNIEEAIEFLSILKNSSRLKSSLRILQISFDLDPREFSESDAPLTSSRISFWKLWGECLGRLQVLHTLTICYDPEDPEFLWRFREEAKVQRLRALRCLHLAYLSDCHPVLSRVIELDEPDTVIWNHDPLKFKWSEGLVEDQYCHLGEYRFFNPMFYTGADRVPARLCGFSEDLFEDWPGDW
ncbi:hypothetical protein C8F04DRAFT_1259586 [Mycena alexandri]|uniref:Uncharacterized protein n=1 Tax=Mycena alexandri TaxID=1745969 RepID=A0AAD6X345_9AGAR|nr:hypothetical protein C8F04DRAFT_1259586 [Mycena alexandri]